MSVANLKQMIQEDRVIRQKWVGEDAQGRETACLLAAISPEVAKSHKERDCPAELMPEWFARLTPWIDDSGTLSHWMNVIKRYADLAGRWHVLSAEDWQRIELKTKRVIVLEAKLHTENEQVLKACDGAVCLLDKAIGGEVVTQEEWRKARDASASAATADADATANAANADAAAAATAYASTADAAAATANAAATAYAAAATAYAAAATANAATRQKAREEAADRIIDSVLNALENEINNKETSKQ